MRREYRDWTKTDPMNYFRENYPHVTSRVQLNKEYAGLYQKLKELRKLDEVLPENQNKNDRDWKKTDPVQYFRQNFSYVKSRKQLAKKDQGLYNILWKMGKLGEVLPETQRRDYGKIDPVKLFKQEYSHVKSRSQLEKEEDPGLYSKLLKENRLDEVLPKRINGRNWNNLDPVKYFKENCLHIKSRKQLNKEDKGLYEILLKKDKLDEVLPKKRDVRNWTKQDPVELFKQRYSHVKGREQLRNEDPGLYAKLLRDKRLDEVLPSADSIKKRVLEDVVKRYVG